MAAAARGSSGSAACDRGCLSEEEGRTVVGGRLLTIVEAAFGERRALPRSRDVYPTASSSTTTRPRWEEGHPCIPKGEEVVTAA